MLNNSQRGRWSLSIVVGPLLGSLLVFGLIAENSLAAGPIVDSKGFEGPAFNLGNLDGQQGWVTAGVGSSTAVVQNAVAQSGTQAVTVTRNAAINSDRRWFVPQTGFPTQRFVTVDWDMRVQGPSGNVGLNQFGPFFGVETYDADSGVFVLGALGVDATTGDVLIQAQTSGALTETGHFATFGQWNHFRMVMDFATDTYRNYFNGIHVATTGFVDVGFGLDNFTDADIATFAAAPDAASMALGGTAQFDNFIIRDGLLGDYDIDGDVDANDYTRWRTTFGTAVGVAGNDADGNKNGVVDAADYVIWRNNFGQSLFTGISTGAALSSIAVPEPAMAVLALIALPAVVCWTARRRASYVRLARGR